MINAGLATVQLSKDAASGGWELNLHVESAGLVSKLYRVVDSYTVATTNRFCLVNATLDAQEGKKHTISKMAVDEARKKVAFEERDLIEKKTATKELEIAPCTYEVASAMAYMRTLNLDPGRSTVVPVTDGKRFTPVRLAAQSRDKISVGGKSYRTTRYEAYLFDEVLYKRHGRLLVWISDDADHVPVQFRLVLGFPIGTVTISLEKQERQ